MLHAFPQVVAALDGLGSFVFALSGGVLAGDVPTVLRADLYALAAASAAARVVSFSQVLNVRPLYPMLLGAATCIFLRVMAIYRGWRVPVAHWRADGTK